MKRMLSFSFMLGLGVTGPLIAYADLEAVPHVSPKSAPDPTPASKQLDLEWSHESPSGPVRSPEHNTKKDLPIRGHWVKRDGAGNVVSRTPARALDAKTFTGSRVYNAKLWTQQSDEDRKFVTFIARATPSPSPGSGTVFCIGGATFTYVSTPDAPGRCTIMAKKSKNGREEWVPTGISFHTDEKGMTPTARLAVRFDREAGTWALCVKNFPVRDGFSLDGKGGKLNRISVRAGDAEEAKVVLLDIQSGRNTSGHHLPMVDGHLDFARLEAEGIAAGAYARAIVRGKKPSDDSGK